MANDDFWTGIIKLCDDDVKVLRKKEQFYGDSWKKRGGVGAFMMLARKWDRIENWARSVDWDVFKADPDDAKGVLDDISDLRRYLLLVENETQLRHRGDPESGEPTSSYVDQDHECSRTRGPYRG